MEPSFEEALCDEPSGQEPCEGTCEQIVALEMHRDQLTKLIAMPPDEPLLRSDLEELRHMARPPGIVRQCLEIIYIVLHVSKVRGRLRNLPRGQRFSVPWELVRRMVMRYDTFFCSMEQYDIAQLIAAPEVVEYLARTYFKGDDLAEVRVRRSSRACAALIRWYGDAMARVEGALELLTVTAQLAVLKPPSEEPLDRRRLCESIRGERPCDIAAKRLLWFCGADPLTWRR